MTEPLSELQECLVEQVRLTDAEKKRRVYYQDIVYSVCNSLDRIFGNRISRGEGVVCGTSETPTTNVQDLMQEVEKRCSEWVRIQHASQKPQMPLPKAEPPEWNGIPAKDRKLWFGIAHEGMEAPWLSGMGACLVKIWDIRRREDGVVEYGIGNETRPESGAIGWITADKFFDEWPQ